MSKAKEEGLRKKIGRGKQLKINVTLEANPRDSTKPLNK